MRSRWHSALAAVLAGALCFALASDSAAAQVISSPQGSSSVDAPSATVRPESFTSVTVHGDPNDVPRELIRAEAEREVKLEETQRIAVVVPNFNTVVSGEGVMLDKRQKLDLAWHTAADPFNVVGAFVLGGASELNGTHKGFGWGPAGYGKRVGANLADVLDGTMLAGAVYPILLHQDPRYFRKGSGSFSSRLRHALAAPYLCRGDNGRTQPNASNLLGNFSAGAISNLYYPDAGFRLTMLNSAIVTIEGSLGTIGLEFAPDVAAHFHRRKSTAAPVVAEESAVPTATDGNPSRAELIEVP